VASLLPLIFFVFSIIYNFFLLSWIVIIMGTHHVNCVNIHVLMVEVSFVAAINLICAIEVKHDISMIGLVSMALKIVFGLRCMVVIVLIVRDCFYLRHFLQRRVLLSVICVQLVSSLVLSYV